MKIYFSIVFLITSFLIIKAQEEMGGYRELYIRTIETDGDTIIFNLKAQGSVWDREGNLQAVYFYLGTEYSLIEDSMSVEGDCPEKYDCWDKGWDNLQGGGIHDPPYFGLGLYKLSVNGSNSYIYLDFSDCDYSNSDEQGDYYDLNDIWVRYVANVERYQIPDGPSSWEFISNGDTLKCWEILPKRIRQDTARTNCFKSWSNSLILIDNFNPIIAWGKSPDAEKYKIYRRVTAYGGLPGNRRFFTHIATADDEIFSYTDIDYTTGGKDSTAHYFVKAVLSSTSQNSNIVNTPVQVYKQSLTEKKLTKNYYLFQNTPNPFNPVTKIEYHLPQDGYTVLKVYNIIGQEVARLVDQSKIAGNYSVEFDATKLPSGIYFYSLQFYLSLGEVSGRTGEFFDVKKMILIK